MAAFLDQLNEAQREAVLAGDKNLLVVAGAGSGKTRVLTHKIAYLLESRQVEPAQILAMTFTNKAAAEMKERIRHLLSGRTVPPYVGTFHSLATRFLRRYASRLGYDEHFAIYDDGDQKSVFKTCLKEKNLDDTRFTPAGLVEMMSSLKNSTVNYLDKLKNKTQFFDARFYELACLYQKKLRDNQAMDFGDLLVNFLYLLRQDPQVREELRGQFLRLFVDEYQDTNRIQVDLLREIYQPGHLICAVGDEDQSIYSWRGAVVTHMLDFERHFAPALILKLEQNYRSTPQILKLANAAISANRQRREKKLWTQNSAGEAPLLLSLNDEIHEAREVADRLEASAQRDRRAFTDFAIFYRTNAQSRALEEELRRRRIPYKIFGGVGFYERKEIKDLLAYLSALVNPRDTVAFLRIVNTPPRGVGEKTLADLTTAAAKTDTPPLAWLLACEDLGPLAKKLGAFQKQMRELAELAKTAPPSKTAQAVLEKTGYWESLSSSDSVDNESRLENLTELLASLKRYEEQTPEASLATFLQEISLYTDVDSYEEEEEVVKLMTIHCAKGLEFPIVFLTGLEEGLFPHRRSLEEPSMMEEERRLFYVAVTRAKENLVMSHATQRRLYLNHHFNMRSRFLDEVPDNLYRSEDLTYRESLFRPSPFPHRREAPKSPFPDYELAEAPAHPYRPGVKVLHPQFGVGIIRKAEGGEADLKLTVTFEDAGTRKLLLRFCALEILP